MPRYVSLGEIPRKRHIQFRKPDGTLYAEQVFGTKGFSGISSILYHCHLPTQTTSFEPMGSLQPVLLTDEPLHHRHLKSARFHPSGDPISGRTVLMANEDVSFGICRPESSMGYFYKNADGDDLLFIHEGKGRLETMFGTLEFYEGDYLVIPRGTIYRVVASSPPALGEGRGLGLRMLV